MNHTSSPQLSRHAWQQLFTIEGLQSLDEDFLRVLHAKAPQLARQLLTYRENICTSAAMDSAEFSEFLIALAKAVESFLIDVFQIHEAVAISALKTTAYNPIASFKKYFVLRRAKKELSRANDYPSFTELSNWLASALQTSPIATKDKELAIALLGNAFLEDAEANKSNIDKLVQWCVKALTTKEGQSIVQHWPSFHIPERTDYNNLVPVKQIEVDGKPILAYAEEKLRLRDGFKLTDARMNAREIQDEVNYCIYCHDHDGDFCSKGFPQKKGDPSQGFKRNSLDVVLTGCPLEEKISEMNILKRDGYTLASLAMVMTDNPMCPATGHRICNDCMKSCIYQKQEPVNIPQIETRVLTDVLALPWGVEIYDLLTRWNPLRQTQYIMKPYNGRKVLIAGMGPAGFTLAHHLLQEGFAVVGFDGLKIEPLPMALIEKPIKHYRDLIESLDERLMAGFGGVAEYGITVRWDKNFLKLIYLSLMRRPHFQVFGSVRFGGTITVEDAWDLGFDHLAVAVGAGLPKALNIPQSLAVGMRQANDFLMALQLGSAAKSSSLTNLQIRMPAVVIGGGLTGVDTATELQAYYIRQVEKILDRYEVLSQHYNREALLQQFDVASIEILHEFVSHGKQVREERALAHVEHRPPNFIKLIRQWGGVTIVYRRRLQESPAYINNHEELKKALEEGIYYIEALEPKAVNLDGHGHCQELVCHQRVVDDIGNWLTTDKEMILPARAILVATGTQPNTAYEFEHRGTFNRLNLQYQHYEDEEGHLNVAGGITHCKEEQFGPFTSYHKGDRRVSLIGDTHPVFHGSVVKAIASGLRTYKKILQVLPQRNSEAIPAGEYAAFAERMNRLFTATLISITRKTAQVLELVIQAPLAAKHYKAGQFYRLQNYETNALHAKDTLLLMEPMPIVAAHCDMALNQLTFLVNESQHTTARLCALFKAGDKVALMGPTGVRAKIPHEKETILVIGGETSFSFMRSFGNKLKASGNQVIFLVKCKRNEIYCQNELEDASHAIIWLTEDGFIKTTRAFDMALMHSDVLAALCQFATQIREATISLRHVDRIFVVGDTNLLREFQQARTGALKEHLVKSPKVFGSVYGNMQCMLKGVCAQCLQWQIDPETGLRTKAVFACSWQDQPLEIIDIDHLDARLQQNFALEQFNHLWLDYLFATTDVARI